MSVAGVITGRDATMRDLIDQLQHSEVKSEPSRIRHFIKMVTTSEPVEVSEGHQSCF